MPRFMVFDAERLRAALLYETQGDDERDVVESVPDGLIPLTGAYVLRNNEVGPRYILPPAGSGDERVVILGGNVPDDSPQQPAQPLVPPQVPDAPAPVE